MRLWIKNQNLLTTMRMRTDGGRCCRYDVTVSVSSRVILLFLFYLQLPLTLSVLSSDVSYPDVTVSTIAFGSCHKRKYAIRHDLPTTTTTPTGNNGDSSSSSIQKTIWPTIAAHDPDVFVWTGDAVYPPKRGIASVQLLQEEYEQMNFNATLGYATFTPRHGVYGTWDDHDYGGNDMGDAMPDKPARAKAFVEFLQHKSVIPRNDSDTSIHPPPSRRQGVYQSIEWGVSPRKVKLLLLDTRWHRSSHCIPSVATYLPFGAGVACVTRWLTAGLALIPYCTEPDDAMLGKEQWDWLEQELHNSDAQVHVVVSSIQVLTTNPVMESWGHYPKERRRLLQLLLLHQRKSGGVVIILSGDVHHAEILDPHAYQYYQQQQDKQQQQQHAATPTTYSSFLEVTSSGLTHDCSKHIYGALCQPLLELFSQHRYRHNNNNNNNSPDDDKKFYYIGRNYGMIHVDWEQETFQVNVHSLETLDRHYEFNQVVLTTGPRSFRSTVIDKNNDLDVDQVIPCLDGHLIPFLQQVIVTILIGTIGTILLFCWMQRRQKRQRLMKLKE